MMAEAKKPQLWRLNPADRLSDLPDPIIHHILSFLAYKEACRTSVLSERWSSIWATTPVLEFKPHYFIKGENPDQFDEESTQKYLTFIEMTMQRYSKMKLSIRKLELKFQAVDHDLVPKIDKWLEVAVNNKVEVLSLSVIQKDSINYRLPPIVFTARSLKSLSCSRVEIPYQETTELISLQSLKLYNVTIDSGLLQKIIDSCPLNSLLLRECMGFKSILIPHSSKLEMLEFWRITGKRGGMIKLESSNIVRLSYYSCGNGIEPPLPCKIVPALRNLRSLGLHGAVVKEDTLPKLLSGIMRLETMKLCSCNLPKSICVSAPELNELGLYDCEGLTSVTIDAPKLETFGYTGHLEIIFIGGKVPPQCKVYFNTDAEIYNTDWFVRLKEYLVKSNTCWSLNLWMMNDLFRAEFDANEAGKISASPPYKLGELKVFLLCSVTEASSLSAFVDGILWCCHPDQLSLPVGFGAEGTIAESFIELLNSKVNCWWHPLKRIEVASTDCSSLLGAMEIEIHFKLHW